MKTINEIQNEIIEEFSLLENKEDKYTYIIELGKKLPPLDEIYKKDENLIKGCQSKVWLIAEWKDEHMIIKGDSDTVIVKGLVSLLIRIVSGQKTASILDTDFYWMTKIGMEELISVNRSNGVSSMIKQLKIYALALQAKHETTR